MIQQEMRVANRLLKQIRDGKYTHSYAEQYCEERGLFEALEIIQSALEEGEDS